MSNPLLTVDQIESFYGPSQALFGVDLELHAGQLVALMGRNGMGKSTTIRSIFGMTPARTGTIQFNGKAIQKMAPHRIAQMGLGLVPEGRRCFRSLSVRENLIATAVPGEWTTDKVEALFPRLAERRNQSANTLSGGEQQMLAIGRALMTNPKLLVLDEATEGLAPVIRKEIWKAVRELKSRGLSILLVDKSLKELMPIADHCVVLEKGRSVWQGQPGDLTEDLTNRYLGV